jgi:hypothetical protein
MMGIKQISVFVENSSGRLAEITSVLAEAGVNLRALTIADTADFGILRVIADDPEKALLTLHEKKYTARATEVIGVELEDKPGALARILKVFSETGVNIEYLYASLGQSNGNAVVVFKIQNLAHGIQIAAQHGLKMVDKLCD